MPRVPEYRSNVQSAGAPNVRFRDSSNIEAFGGGAGNQVSGAISNLGETVGKFQREEADKANKTVVDEANTKLIQGINHLSLDSAEGFMNRRGKAAFGVPQEYGEKYDKLVKDIEGSLYNDSQKEAFGRFKNERRNQFDSDIQRFIFKESDQLMEQTTKSALETSRQDATLNYRNVDIRENAKYREEKLILDHAKYQGWTPEITELQLKLAKSNTHEAILSRAITAGDESFAKEYFEQNKEALQGNARNQVEKATE